MMQKKWMFALSFLLIQGEAALEDHFKKVVGKEEVHSIRNIDFIYLINLDAREEKWEKSKAQLEAYEISPYRFSAVNGWDLTVEDLNEIGLKYTKSMKKNQWGTCFVGEDKTPCYEIMQEGKRYFRPKMTCGMVGCLLSHLSILQDAYDSGYETIWILEDDIVVLQDPRQLSDIIDLLDENLGKGGWDILFTDRDMLRTQGYNPCKGWSERPNFTPKDPKMFKDREVINDTFRQVRARFGTHSMILRRSGIEKILHFVKKYEPFNPYDLDMYLPEGIKLFSVLHDIVRNDPGSASDTLENLLLQ